ncbi:MAG: dTDP-4-dehydrorhamnose reductase [Gemmatimonadaceae bacterium]
MSRVLVLGASGQVGQAVLQSATTGTDFIAPTKAEVDLRNTNQLRAYVLDVKPDAVINCAAYTRVDDAERESDAAYLLNAEAAGIVAEATSLLDARFVHVSTDYVFDGNGLAPYSVDALVAPQSVYGASKLKGEQLVALANPAAAIVRTAWVHSGGDNNFVATAVRIFQQQKVMHVVDDQVSTPTRALHLASALWTFVARANLGGVFHFTDAGVASWYDVAQCVLDTMQRDGLREPKTAVVPVATVEFPRPAARPRVSLLDKHATWKALDIAPQHWRVGVAASTREMTHA